MCMFIDMLPMLCQKLSSTEFNTLPNNKLKTFCELYNIVDSKQDMSYKFMNKCFLHPQQYKDHFESILTYGIYDVKCLHELMRKSCIVET